MEKSLFNKKMVNNFLDKILKRIDEKSFEKALLEVQKIDLKYSKKIITIEELKECIDIYKERDIFDFEEKSFITVLDGNPKDVFSLCLEAIRYNINLNILIEDFCLAQNMFLINEISDIVKGIKIKLDNLISNKELIEKSKKVHKVIFISTSQRYEELKGKIKNSIFYPFDTIDIWYEDEKYLELIEKIYNYSELNRYQIDVYEDIKYEDAIRLINRDSYKFISVIFTEDKNQIKDFKEKVNSAYVFANTNPFNKVQFELDKKILE